MTYLKKKLVTTVTMVILSDLQTGGQNEADGGEEVMMAMILKVFTEFQWTGLCQNFKEENNSSDERYLLIFSLFQ